MVVTARAIASYDARTLHRLDRVAIRPVPVLPTSASVSPDGATVAIGSRGGSVLFVDAANGAAVRGLGGHSAGVASTAFAPDGRTAITAGDDDRVIAWNPSSGAERAVLPGPAGHVENAQVSSDGSTLYTASLGGVLLAWDLTGRRSFGESARVGAGVSCCDSPSVSPPAPPVARSPDGTEFAVPTGTSTVGVFSTATLQRVTSFTIEPPGHPITALAWSPAGGMLAVGAHSGVVQLWDVSARPRLLRALVGLGSLPAGQAEAVQSLAFSPNAQLLAASDKTEGSAIGHTLVSPIAMVATWNVQTGAAAAEPAELDAGAGMNGSDVVAFSPDSKLLAVSLLTGGVRLFDPATGATLRTLPDPGDQTISLAFAPKGHLLAAGTQGGTVEMWDPVTGKQLGSPLLADSSGIAGIAFDAGGRRFVTTGAQDAGAKLWFAASLEQEGPRLTADPGTTASAAFAPSGDGLLVFDNLGRVFTWPTGVAAWEQRACSLAGRNLTRAEWTQLVGGGHYASVCP
jgi:WD40 repeat protein